MVAKCVVETRYLNVLLYYGGSFHFSIGQALLTVRVNHNCHKIAVSAASAGRPKRKTGLGVPADQYTRIKRKEERKLLVKLLRYHRVAL